MKRPRKETIGAEDSFEERRNTVQGDKHPNLKELSKKIEKCTRDRNGTKRPEEIQRMLEEFRGIKSISFMKSGRKRTLIPKGDTITSRKGIANVSGEFFSKPYAENELGEKVQDPQNLETRMNTEKNTRLHTR